MALATPFLEEQSLKQKTAYLSIVKGTATLRAHGSNKSASIYSLYVNYKTKCSPLPIPLLTNFNILLIQRQIELIVLPTVSWKIYLPGNLAYNT